MEGLDLWDCVPWQVKGACSLSKDSADMILGLKALLHFAMLGRSSS